MDGFFAVRLVRSHVAAAARAAGCTVSGGRDTVRKHGGGIGPLGNRAENEAALAAALAAPPLAVDVAALVDVVALADVVRRRPRLGAIVTARVPWALRYVDEPRGRVAALWLLGEVARDVPEAPYALERLIDDHA